MAQLTLELPDLYSMKYIFAGGFNVIARIQ